MKRKKALITAVAVVVVGGAWLLLHTPKRDGITLETATTSRITIRNSVMATGTVEPVTEVDVGTQVSGIIDKLYVDYNDVVHAGQLIAEMDKVTLQAELEQSEAELASSKTEYEYQTKNYARTRTLHEKELVSDAEYDEAFYQYEKSRNAYEQAQAAIVKVRRNLDYATITSPIDGVVISRAVEEGQTVAASFETPTLFTIAQDLTQMQVVADVDEADIGQVQDGQRVEFTVDAYPDDTFEGTVQQVRLEATTESSVVTYEVVISAYNPDLKLKPGLTANVTIYTLEKENALAVPTKALRFVPDAELLAELGVTVAAERGSESGKRELWVKSGDTLTPRYVTTGAASGELTEIIDGLADGEQVVADLTAAVAAPAAAAAERSPFMPSPPEATRKRNSRSKASGPTVRRVLQGQPHTKNQGIMNKEVIRLEEIRRDFQVGDETVHALRGVSFTIREGEFVTIMGTSGSGKSTLLNTLGCLDTPTSGEYYLDGVAVRTMDKNQRATLRNRKIGFVFQNYNLLPKTTAIENVELPLMYNSSCTASERYRRAVEALRAVGLGDRLLHKSNQMSGGQMQRVAIARALVNDPAVILADEATGNLDTRTSFEVLVLFQQLHAAGRTIIFVTHNPEIARYSSRNITLRDGRITDDVRNDHILSAAEALARLPKTDD